MFLRTAKIAITRRTEQVCSFFMAEFDKVGASVFLQIGTPLWENTQIHRSRSTSELNCQGIDPRNLTLCISTFSWPRLQLEISRPDCLRFRFLKPHGNEVFCLVPWQHLATFGNWCVLWITPLGILFSIVDTCCYVARRRLSAAMHFSFQSFLVL